MYKKNPFKHISALNSQVHYTDLSAIVEFVKVDIIVITV